MKVSVDGESLFELSEIQKQVIKNDIPHDIFDADMKRRLEYILMHKYERCFERLKKEWVDDLDASGNCKLNRCGISSIPLDRNALSTLIFQQASYKCRKTREDEAIALQKANQEEALKAQQAEKEKAQPEEVVAVNA